MTTYLEMLEKIQDRTLENVKQLQAVQISTLTTVREIIGELPTAKGMPTATQIIDLGSSFANKLVEQQKMFVTEVSDAVKPATEPKPLVVASSN